jgi:RNA 3'-terminal phosphate cyclase (ATP)
LKSQHVTAIEYLAKATAADVTGLSVGSHTLEFRPRLKPSALVEGKDRTIKISADSPAASTLLIFQAVFPFLLFAGTEKGEPITLEISGGTNVSFSLSYEYLDQVLLPTLQGAFGISVERKLHSRGWSLGKLQRGKVTFSFTPLKPGETLKLREEGSIYGGSPGRDVEIEEVDVSMIVPAEMHEPLTDALVANLEELFPGAKVNFKIIEDSGAESRVYVLLVAKSGALRWGSDTLSSMPKKSKGNSGPRPTISFCEDISRRIAKKLFDEVATGGVVDEFLQDQLVIFQALSEGRTSFPRGESDGGGLEQAVENLEIDERMRKDRTDKPFGEGSMHTTTARWVTAQLLPSVAWYNRGRICEGVGMNMGSGKAR